MAYRPENMRIYSYMQGAVRSLDRRVWGYEHTTDTLANIETAGYFTDPQTNMKQYDWLLARCSDGQRRYIVVSVINGIITIGNDSFQQGVLDRVDFLERLIVELQPAGHGSMSMTDGPQAGADLGVGWLTLDQMNQIIVSERGVNLFVDTGEASFNAVGNWELVFQVNFSHDSSPSTGRTTNIRLFNVPDSTPGQSVPIGIGRNVMDSQVTAILGFEVASADLEENFRFEIGGGDTITDVVYNTVSLQCYYHDRLGALILPTVLGF